MQFLVPYDGSDQARRALELCLKLVKPEQDFVYLLSVVRRRSPRLLAAGRSANSPWSLTTTPRHLDLASTH